MEKGTILSVEKVDKSFIVKKKNVQREISALSDLSFDVKEGEFLSIVGPERLRKVYGPEPRRRPVAALLRENIPPGRESGRD